MGFRFVHMADVHLESPFQGRTAATRQKLRDATYEAFSRAIQLAVDRRADAVLIAGDLFDSDRLSFATERLLMEALTKLGQARISVCYALGNHDPASMAVSGYQLAWPDHVNRFATDIPRTVDIWREGILVGRVTGSGHVSPAESRNLVADFPAVQDGSVPHVGLVHAQVVGAAGADSHQRYAPATRGDFRRDYAYWALGHVHQRQQVADDPPVWFPGNLQGRHANEAGPKGALWVEIPRDRPAYVRFVPLAPLVWERWEHACHPNVTNMDQLVQAIVAEHATSEATTTERMVRLQLRGETPLYAALRHEENQAALADLLQERLDLELVEIETTEVRRPIDRAAYYARGGLLELIEQLGTAAGQDEALLQKLAPDILAGLPAGEQAADYLRKLLSEAQSALIERLIPEEPS